MINIYGDDHLIFSSRVNGADQPGYVLTSATLTDEINKSGSLNITVPPSNVNYKSLKKLKTIIRVEENGQEIWRGRILDDRKDFYGNREVLCEGELSFLNDIFCNGKFDYSEDGIKIQNFFETLIDQYESLCDPDKKISLGRISNPDMLIYPSVSEKFAIIGECINNVLDEYGGYLRIRREEGLAYLDYLDGDSLEKGTQTINFGENLLDLSEYVNAADVYTHIIPIGKDGLLIKKVNGGVPYIFSEEGKNLYGTIYKIVNYDDVKNASKLLEKARKELDSAIIQATTIDITAIDLSMMNVEYEKLKVGTLINVISHPHGINSFFLCSKITRDLLNPANNEYTLGVDTTSITGLQAKDKKERDYNAAFIRDVSITVSGDAEETT